LAQQCRDVALVLAATGLPAGGTGGVELLTGVRALRSPGASAPPGRARPVAGSSGAGGDGSGTGRLLRLCAVGAS
jgi:hypothetical protein